MTLWNPEEQAVDDISLGDAADVLIALGGDDAVFCLAHKEDEITRLRAIETAAKKALSILDHDPNAPDANPKCGMFSNRYIGQAVAASDALRAALEGR